MRVDVVEEIVTVPAGEVVLEGNLALPGDAEALVLFAHGSGSSRHSPRNRFVAEALQEGRLATLLVDLLTVDEEARDRIHRPGTLFAAGLITGEALMGIAIAVPIVVSTRADVLALPESWYLGMIGGLVVLAIVAWLMYRTATRDRVA